MTALSFAQQSLGVLMQLLFALFDAGGGVERVGIRPQPSLCVIITPSPYSRFYDPEGRVSCRYLLASQEVRIMLVRSLLARLIRDTCTRINASMKPRCIQFQG
jgi:hypothetical protein